MFRFPALIFLLLGSSLVSAMNPFVDESVTWENESGKWLLVPAEGIASLKLFGSILTGKRIYLNGTEVSVSAGQFVIELALAEATTPFEFRLLSSDGSEIFYRVVYKWIKERKPTKKDKTRKAQDWLALEVPQAEVPQPEAPARFSLRVAELSGILALDNLGGLLVTVGIHWAPEFYWTPKWTLSSGVGFLPLKTNTSRVISVLEYKVALRRLIVEGIELEGSAGGQTWFGLSAFVPTVGVSLRFSRDLFLSPAAPLAFVKHLIVGYAIAAGPNNLHQIRLGASFRF